VVKPVAQAPVPQVVAPGTIEGHVVRRKGLDELPIEGARVTLWPAGEREETPELPPEAETRSKADGSFHFAQLKPGDYALRAQVGRGALHETHARIAEKGPGVPVKIVFGGTRIHGHAYDEQGEALAGVPIRLDGGHEFQFELRARATTGERGEYSFDELPPGKYFGLATEDWQAQWPGRMWILTLVEDDDVELDLGEPRPLPHWRGSVRSASGAAVLSGGTVHLERVLRTKLGSEAKTYREVLFDGSAAFDLRLERGSWQPGVSLRSRPETRRMFAPLQISADDLQHDLVLAGARVHGTVFDSLTQKPLEGYVGTLQVSVRKARTDNPDGGQTVELEQGAQFAIDMLDEGEWEILTFPLLVAAGGHKLGFVIGSGETEKQVDVQVQKP
jgi:protocatechuate 3,4-dioxygenase beta subunit